MDKILNTLFEYFPKLTIKQMFTFVIIVVAYFLCSLFLTSCGTSSHVQGTRKVEKSVIHEQQYEFGKQNTTVLTNRVIYSTTKKRS